MVRVGTQRRVGFAVLCLVDVCCFGLVSIHPPPSGTQLCSFLTLAPCALDGIHSNSFPRVGIRPRPHSLGQTSQYTAVQLNPRAYAGTLGGRLSLLGLANASFLLLGDCLCETHCTQKKETRRFINSCWIYTLELELHASVHLPTWLLFGFSSPSLNWVSIIYFRYS